MRLGPAMFYVKTFFKHILIVLTLYHTIQTFNNPEKEGV